MTDSKPYVSMSDLLLDKARLDALEKTAATIQELEGWGRWWTIGPGANWTIREVADRLLTAPPAK